jgi:hypothetical protein
VAYITITITITITNSNILGMKGFKRCSNGHFYKEDLQTCPHCSGGTADNDLGKTKVNTTQGGDFDKLKSLVKEEAEMKQQTLAEGMIPLKYLVQAHLQLLLEEI